MDILLNRNMKYDKGAAGRSGFYIKTEIDSILAAFELEIMLLFNGWDVRHETDFSYSATHAGFPGVELIVDYFNVRIFRGDNPCSMQQSVKDFVYYDWFEHA